MAPVIVEPTLGLQIRSADSENVFTIGRKLGEGFFSFVFECSDLWDNELIAKVLKPNNEPFEAVAARALSESENLVALRHPNIVAIYDAFQYGNLFYIIAERCQNDLSNLISNSWYEGEYWVKPIAKCVLEAAYFCHKHNIVHCDIHLGNVLYTQHLDQLTKNRGNSIAFKLSDLGVAKLTESVACSGTFHQSIRPPECLNPEDFGAADYRVDIYQTGLLLLQVLLGEKIEFTPEERLAGEPRSLALKFGGKFASPLEKMLRRHVIHRSRSALNAWLEIAEA